MVNKGGIEFRAVVKHHGPAEHPPALDHISFSIPKGTLTTLLGPSGCGKTTTLRLIGGLELPTSGSVWIDGVDVTGVGPSKRQVSMVFQGYALFPHLNVIKNVEYGLEVSGISEDERIHKAHHALSMVGLHGLDRRMPSELSGGQQQRVALARALVLEPAVLLFDEPLSGLDSRLRRSMREEIRTLQRRLRLTVAYVTHDQAEALAISDQIIVMNQGRIAQIGSPTDLYMRPNSKFVATFMGEAKLVKARCLERGTLQIGSLTLTANFDAGKGPVTVAIRPQAWEIQDPSQPGLPGTVTKHAYLGSHQEATVQTELGEVFVVYANTAAEWLPGSLVALKLRSEGVALIP